jgi:hypothetical protein
MGPVAHVRRAEACAERSGGIVGAVWSRGGAKRAPRGSHHAAAQVVLFYDGESSGAAAVEAARAAVVGARALVSEGWKYYEVDTSAAASRDLAAEAGLRGSVSVFVRTQEDGIDEVTLPLTAANVARVLVFRGAAGNPRDVHSVGSREALGALVEAEGAAFVRFVDPACSYCLRMRRQFESGATFFRGRVAFASVDCAAHAALCDAEEVREYPTLRLYVAASAAAAATPGAQAASVAGLARIPYTGARIAAAYELFFHDHRALIPPAQGAAAAESAAKQFLFDRNAPVASIYPLRADNSQKDDARAQAHHQDHANAASWLESAAGKSDFVPAAPTAEPSPALAPPNHASPDQIEARIALLEQALATARAAQQAAEERAAKLERTLRKAQDA